MSSQTGAKARLSSPTWRPWLGQRSGGGLLELRALARMSNVRITVVPRATSEQVFTIKPAQKQRLVVLLFSGDHFDTLLPEDGKAFPQQIKDVVTEPPIVPMRGGGGSSRCTVWTDAASVASAAGARPTSSQRVPDAAPTVCSKPPSQCCFLCFRKRLAAVLLQAPSPCH